MPSERNDSDPATAVSASQVLGVLPRWNRLSSSPIARAATRGVNAAVVGILLAALIDPIAAQALMVIS